MSDFPIDPVVLTASGQYVNILNPDPATLDIRDIAWALSNVHRFTGHTAKPYTVAEHCLRVAGFLRGRGYTPASQLAGLLHDASEAYLGDVSSPLKALLPDYKAIEKNFERTIELRFNVSFIDRPEVKMADLALLASERKYLMPETPEYRWGIIEGLDPDEYAKVTHKDEVRWGGRSHDELVGWYLRVYDKLTREVLNG